MTYFVNILYNIYIDFQNIQTIVYIYIYIYIYLFILNKIVYLIYRSFNGVF